MRDNGLWEVFEKDVKKKTRKGRRGAKWTIKVEGLNRRKLRRLFHDDVILEPLSLQVSVSESSECSRMKLNVGGICT